MRNSTGIGKRGNFALPGGGSLRRRQENVTA
jgi:hypothetical protein